MTRGDQGTHTKRDSGIEDRRRRKRKPERDFSPCYTKKGPGREHHSGPGKKKAKVVKPDSIDKCWLNSSWSFSFDGVSLAVRERNNANARRKKAITHEL